MRRHVGIGHIGHLGCDAEVAIARVHERHVVQVALHAEVDDAGGALVDGIAHVVARRLGNVERQVAKHARAVGAGQLALQVEHAGMAALAMRDGRVAGAPGGFRLALRIGIGKARFRHLHLHLVAVELPLQLRRQLIDRHHRLFEHAGQIESALGDRQSGGAAGLARIELGGGTAQPRRADAPAFGWRLRRQAEGAHAPLGFIGLERIERTLPARVDALDQTARRKRFEGLVRGVAQRQTVGDEREGAQIEAVGLEGTMLCHLAARRRVLEPQIAAGPA